MYKCQTNFVHLREQSCVQWMEIVSFLPLGKFKRTLYMHQSKGVFLAPKGVGSHDTSHVMDLMFVSPKSICCSPHFQCDGTRRWGLWEVTKFRGGREGGAPMKGPL